MSRASWDGAALLGALECAVATLDARVDEVNALNVFPVPDGDTGSNMLATVQAAISEAATVPPAERTVARVAAAFGFGALMGARGNSGVILSQFFRGIADAVDGQRELDGRDLAHGFGRACDAAYAAVGKPVEGTMLTVARELSNAAREAAEHDGGLEAVLGAAAEAASAAVARTPEQLLVLRQAGVVDAGGRGLELLVRGALAYAREEPMPVTSDAPSGGFHSLELSPEEDDFGYETVFMVQPPAGERLVLAQVRDRLEQIGKSVVVAGDERALKVHVHSERPDEVIAYGLALGTLSNIAIENLDGQTHDVGAGRRGLMDGSARGAALQRRSGPAALRDARAVIAVAPGDGFARIFDRLGAAAAVVGGQGANPSAGQLAEAIHATGASDVIVLPNNANVLLAARQAGELCPDVRLEVVATRNAAEGVAAMFAFDAHADLPTNARSMLRTARALQTMQVTAAVRDARIGRRKVHRGEYIVLGTDDALLAVDRDRDAAIITALERLENGAELVTVYHGQGTDAAEARRLGARIGERMSGAEVEVVEGGQPHYSYLIAVE